jgi:hypothetical protein
MGNHFHTNLNDHDSQLSYLTRNSYSYFRGFPVYYMDDAFKPLAKLCDQLGNRKDEEAEQLFKQAVDNNSLFKEFVTRLLGTHNLYVRDGNFLHKAGDIVLNLNNSWHMIELKTTRRNTFSINANSLHQFAKIDKSAWVFIHFLFYSYLDNTYKMIRYDQLFNVLDKVKLCFHTGVSTEVLMQTIEESPFAKQDILVCENKNTTIKDQVDCLTNLYYEFDLSAIYGDRVMLMSNYMDSLVHSYIQHHAS